MLTKEQIEERKGVVAEAGPLEWKPSLVVSEAASVRQPSPRAIACSIGFLLGQQGK